MDRLDWAIELIQEAQREKRYIQAMKNDIDKLSIYDPNYWQKHYEISQKYTRVPDRSIIDHNLRLARRILLDECR